jgi:hypothetical protein
VPLDGLALVSMDTSCATDDVGDVAGVACGGLESQVERFTHWFSGPLFDGSPTWLVTHKPVWGLANPDDPTPRPRNVVLQRAIAQAKPKGLELAVAGHVHLYETISMQNAAPPQLVVGNGGTAHDGRTPALSLDDRVISETHVESGFAAARWGFTLVRTGDAKRALETVDDGGARIASCESSAKGLACVAEAPPLAPAK